MDAYPPRESLEEASVLVVDAQVHAADMANAVIPGTCIEEIEATRDYVKAFVEVHHDEALTEAIESDKRTRAGKFGLSPTY
jgi:Asp-tRNA(Asn)/Glu-tRNA(Gln) amidotransferase A subunit family amidase